MAAQLNNPSIKWGLIGAGVIIVLDLVLSLFSDKVYILGSSYTALPVIVITMVMAVKEYKFFNDGYASFKEALTASWLTYLITGLITTLFVYIHLNFIQPSLLEAMKEVTREAMEKMSGLMGEEAAEKAMESIENQNPAAPLTLLSGLPVKYFFAGIPALIIAAVMKQERSEFNDLS